MCVHCSGVRVLYVYCPGCTGTGLHPTLLSDCSFCEGRGRVQPQHLRTWELAQELFADLDLDIATSD